MSFFREENTEHSKFCEQLLTRTLKNGPRKQPPSYMELKVRDIFFNNVHKRINLNFFCIGIIMLISTEALGINNRYPGQPQVLQNNA